MCECACRCQSHLFLNSIVSLSQLRHNKIHFFFQHLHSLIHLLHSFVHSLYHIETNGFCATFAVTVSTVGPYTYTHSLHSNGVVLFRWHSCVNSINRKIIYVAAWQNETIERLEHGTAAKHTIDDNNNNKILNENEKKEKTIIICSAHTHSPNKISTKAYFKRKLLQHLVSVSSRFWFDWHRSLRFSHNSLFQFSCHFMCVCVCVARSFIWQWSQQMTTGELFWQISSFV